MDLMKKCKIPKLKEIQKNWRQKRQWTKLGQEREQVLMIVPELLKQGGVLVVEQLTKLFQRVWEQNRIARQQMKNLINPLHKKGSSYECNNYRTICLSFSSTVYKIYTRMLERRLRKVVEEEMKAKQVAYWPGCIFKQ